MLLKDLFEKIEHFLFNNEVKRQNYQLSLSE